MHDNEESASSESMTGQYPYFLGTQMNSLSDMFALQAMALSKRQAYRRSQYLTSGHPSQSTKTHQATGTS